MIRTYLGIEIKMLFRKKVYLALSILLPLVFYLLFTSIIDIPSTQQEIFYKEYMYSMVTFSLTSFCLMSFPVDLIEEHQIGWQKQLLNTRMSYPAYYMTKVFKTMIQFALSIVVIFIVAATVRNISMSVNEWLISGVTLWICASLFLSIGILLAQVNDLQKASSLGNILYIVLAMVGGLWFPVSQFPEWLKVIAYKSPTYHMKQIALDIGKGEHFNWQSMLVLLIYSVIFVGIALLLKRKRGASK